MKKFIAPFVLALILFGLTTPAQAHYRHGGHEGRPDGFAFGIGILGGLIVANAIDHSAYYECQPGYWTESYQRRWNDGYWTETYSPYTHMTERIWREGYWTEECVRVYHPCPRCGR